MSARTASRYRVRVTESMVSNIDGVTAVTIRLERSSFHRPEAPVTDIPGDFVEALTAWLAGE